MSVAGVAGSTRGRLRVCFYALRMVHLAKVTSVSTARSGIVSSTRSRGKLAQLVNVALTLSLSPRASTSGCNGKKAMGRWRSRVLGHARFAELG